MDVMKNLTWNEFERVEIRVGTILWVSDFPKAHKPAYQLKIDFGPLGILKTSAQITRRYTKEELIGRQISAVVNFPDKQIANFKSQCLVLGAMGAGGDVVLFHPDVPVENGLRIG